MLKQRDASWLASSVSLPPSAASHTPAATSEPALFIETLSGKKSFHRLGGEGPIQLLSHPQTVKTRHISRIKLIYLVKGGVN